MLINITQNSEMLVSGSGFLVPKKEFANSVVPESANRDLEGKLGEKHRVVGHFFYREQLKSKNAARIPHFSYRKEGRIDESEGKGDENECEFKECLKR